jgi:glycosyltransferase involved in cell wall biosynthesis
MSAIPLVTVYVLNYNYAQYLEKCINSVLAQSYRNIELIVIDDGSTDDSLKVLEQYEKNDNIKLIFQENIGLLKSIIKAFMLAQGEYVVRVDADDWVVPNFVESMVSEVVEHEEIAMVFPDYYEVDEIGKILHRVKRRDFSTEVTLFDQPAHGACTLTKKEAYLKVGGHNQELQCQDGVDIWLAITEKYKVKNHKKPLFYYRKHRRSLTTDYSKIFKNRAMIYRDHAVRRGYKPGHILAFIAVREDIIGGDEFVFNQIGGKTLLDWTIDKALVSKEIKEVVVSTDSIRIKKYVEKYYSSNTDKNIVVHKRKKKYADQGMHIDNSIRNYFSTSPVENLPVLVMLTPNSPFSTASHIDTAIYSTHIFNTSIVDSVIEDSSILYHHDGNGLVELTGGSIRHERDIVYVRKGGITVYGKKHISYLVKNSSETIKPVKGHVVIDEYSAFEVKNMNDIGIADYIAKKIIGT